MNIKFSRFITLFQEVTCFTKNNPELTDKFSLLSINSGLFHSNSASYSQFT